MRVMVALCSVAVLLGCGHASVKPSVDTPPGLESFCRSAEAANSWSPVAFDQALSITPESEAQRYWQKAVALQDAENVRRGKLPIFRGPSREVSLDEVNILIAGEMLSGLIRYRRSPGSQPRLLKPEFVQIYCALVRH